jgi:hypothetical protein
MSESATPARITATPAAREAITALRAAGGGPVMFIDVPSAPMTTG